MTLNDRIYLRHSSPSGRHYSDVDMFGYRQRKQSHKSVGSFNEETNLQTKDQYFEELTRTSLEGPAVQRFAMVVPIHFKYPAIRSCRERSIPKRGDLQANHRLNV